MSGAKKMFIGGSNFIDEDSEERDSKRKTRNLSEKNRRDQFNQLINQLSAVVSTSEGHKMDKSTVLKSTISLLKNHNAVVVKSRQHEIIHENWNPNFLTNDEFTNLILDAFDGFLVVLNNAGEILYISQNVNSILGYFPDDILGTTIYDLGCTDEQNDLHNILSSPSIDEHPVSFSCHLRRANYNQKQHRIYDLIRFVGYFRTNLESDKSDLPANTESRLVFIATGCLHIPTLTNEIYFKHLSSIKTEFTSKLSLEWKFLYLDDLAPSIIGYLPFELLGTSCYDYYHIDDLDAILSSHDALIQNGEAISCYYRFLTKGQQWIWLQTKFYITHHQLTHKPELIRCRHRVVKLNRTLIIAPLERCSAHQGAVAPTLGITDSDHKNTLI